MVFDGSNCGWCTLKFSVRIVPVLLFSRYIIHMMACEMFNKNLMGRLRSCRFVLGRGYVVLPSAPNGHINCGSDHDISHSLAVCGFVGACDIQLYLYVASIMENFHNEAGSLEYASVHHAEFMIGLYTPSSVYTCSLAVGGALLLLSGVFLVVIGIFQLWWRCTPLHYPCGIAGMGALCGLLFVVVLWSLVLAPVPVILWVYLLRIVFIGQ